MQKVKLADLWVIINVNSLNLVESLLLTDGERQGQGVYSASWGPTLEHSMPSSPEFPLMPTAQ